MMNETGFPALEDEGGKLVFDFVDGFWVGDWTVITHVDEGFLVFVFDNSISSEMHVAGVFPVLGFPMLVMGPPVFG